MKRLGLPVMTILGIIFVLSMIRSQSIISTKHNLSAGSSNAVKATTESEICIFCHTPHNSSAQTPLWNRSDPGMTFTLYAASTANATMQQPDGASLQCLSCHDGTIALGSVVSRSAQISFGSVTTIPLGASNLEKNLSNDHPISFHYTASLASSDGQLKQPSAITPPVELDVNGKMQCTSCHDPHKNTSSKFLTATNEYSLLCRSCHEINSWTSSAHYSSTKTWNNNGSDPWPRTNFNNVTRNGCENCHNPHSAGGAVRLLNYAAEENNCLTCHNGNVAQTNINLMLGRLYKHNVATYNGVHDPTESGIPTLRHVECSDCHNPHRSNSTTATAPNVKGYNMGVKGINSAGNEVANVSYTYEICFRCHSTATWITSPTTRQYTTTNTRLEFQTSNPSFHPIIGPGVNTDVPSLLAGWNTSSVMYCTDCHASDGANNPKGPHGSTYNHQLKSQYLTTDPAPSAYSSANYQLCWNCHRETGTNSVRGNTTFSEHNKHVFEKRTPCNTCHDPHGVNGGTTENNSKLINFNTSAVSTYNGQRRFVRTGYRSGYCELRCHGKNHDSGMNYPD